MENTEKEVVADRRSARSGYQSLPGERPVRVPTVVFLRGTFRCQYAQCGLLLLPWTRPPKWPSQGSIFKIVASVCISCLPAFMFEQLMSYEAHFMRHIGNIRWTVRAIAGHHSQYRCGGGIAERARAFLFFPPPQIILLALLSLYMMNVRMSLSNSWPKNCSMTRRDGELRGLRINIWCNEKL